LELSSAVRSRVVCCPKCKRQYSNIDVVFDDDSWQINPLMACLSGRVTDVEGDGADYLLQAGESAESEAFVRELAQCVPQHGDALMTIV